MEKGTQHHDLLHCPRVKCKNFANKFSNKTKQMTNWSISTFKGKVKFFPYKIVKYVFTAVLGNSKTQRKIVCKIKKKIVI